MSTKALDVVRAPAKVFEDGLLGIKAPTELAPGDYEAVIVLTPIALSAPAPDDVAPLEPLERFIDRMRREHLQAALARANGNRTQAAKLLGVDVRTVFRFLGETKSE